MVWKSERQRSVTFRRRIPRPPLGGLNLQGNPESNWRVMACTALIVPARGRDHGPANDWVVLVRDEILSQARQRLLRRGKATMGKNNDDRKQ